MLIPEKNTDTRSHTAAASSFGFSEFADPLPAFGDDIASLAWHKLQLAHGTDGKTAALSARSTWPFFKKSLYIAPTERLGGEEVGADDHVIVHGRFSNTGLPKNWIAADIVRIADGVLTEHWDVLQDEVTVTESQSGLPIFGEKFPK
jgi:hypothetical protein